VNDSPVQISQFSHLIFICHDRQYMENIHLMCGVLCDLLPFKQVYGGHFSAKMRTYIFKWYNSMFTALIGWQVWAFKGCSHQNVYVEKMAQGPRSPLEI